jgi:hypothetical protein
LILFAIQADATLKSTFKSVMGHQFLRKCFGFPSFITKPTKEEVVKCEGYLTFQECLFSLKNMKYFKSPGIDGFTVEFYKF